MSLKSEGGGDPDTGSLGDYLPLPSTKSGRKGDWYRSYFPHLHLSNSIVDCSCPFLFSSSSIGMLASALDSRLDFPIWGEGSSHFGLMDRLIHATEADDHHSDRDQLPSLGAALQLSAVVAVIRCHGRQSQSKIILSPARRFSVPSIPFHPIGALW